MRARLLWSLIFLIIISSLVWAADKEQREATEPSFSTDAAQIVYIEQVTPPHEVLPSTGEIWTMFADGGGARRLTQGFKDSQPRFSPDSKQIVFVRDLQLWLINTDGTNLRRVGQVSSDFSGGVDFSNDGKSLFFLRAADTVFTEKDLDADPLIALGIGDVPVQYDLQTGQERVLLSEEYGVQQIAANHFDSNLVFVLCHALDNAGKPILQGGEAIAVVNLQGAPNPRTVFAPGAEYDLSDLRVSTTNNAVSAITKTKYSNHVYLLQNNALQKVESLSFLGDISFDGKILLGTALNDEIQWCLALYDIETKKLTLLERKENK